MKSGEIGVSRTAMKRTLGARDASLFSDLVRFRMLTNDFIHCRHASHLQANAVVKITGRLVRQGWLQKYPLFDRHVYFRAGLKLVQLKGLSKASLLPLGPQALATHFATLSYCSSHGEVDLPTRDDYASHLGWLPKKFRDRRLLVDHQTDPSSIRLLRVDLGGTATHVTRKCEKDVARRMQIPTFNAMVKQGRVRIALITLSEAKERQIKNRVGSKTWPTGLRFQIFVVPELIHFVGKQSEKSQ